MIIFRYIAKEVLLSFSAVAGILLVIIMSGRFIHYLSRAATGRLKSDYLFQLIGYQIPDFLLVLLPLSIFLGILLAYGRLYVDSEMTVLRACGVSSERLLLYAMVPGILVTLMVGALSLAVAPWASHNAEWILAKQKTFTEFDMLLPSRFNKASQGRVTYTERLSEDRKRMDEVFIASLGVGASRGKVTLLLAETGTQEIKSDTGSRYLVLNEGYRYDFVPGEPELRITRYEKYGFKIPKNEDVIEISEAKALSTPRLYGDDPEHRAELLWRLALPVMVPILVMLAVPLSRVNPRQGRFIKLIPSIILYLVYLGSIMATRAAVEDDRLDWQWAMWPIHLGFLMLAIVLNWGGAILRRFRARPAVKVA
ncbi:LPS export ABC transporter permease LptF [Aestuariirhabdus sp. Z084]|uniref:LPS export ABC transporter permease LptF n=1 Tax=Aestuariirhabdus haliotis TaxID=2918751 RepID=UPI00201B4190|nr:LPS export ABC transporter permease LptF [Aestuariirhabdus haliotis]MCL6415889.1 LPS export ABC transporter permease LptF [Aestuariirhabdus haliotis]MCL6419887.1 LPS export ABC transporter permease LptF [Aestuariirhabdus haliotis]